MTYEAIRIKGVEGQEELLVHMCQTSVGDAVEFFIPGCYQPIILSESQFRGVMQWIEQQFDALHNQVRHVN